MIDPFDRRRAIRSLAQRALERVVTPSPPPQEDDPPRLTLRALEKISMSRSRERILQNLDEMYTEAFQRAKLSEDEQQMAALDFAYRREQLYFEILLDIRDGMERR